MSLYWYRKLHAEWEQTPPADWFIAADHRRLGWKPPPRRIVTLAKELPPPVVRGTPSYDEVMAEFDRRMELLNKPKELLPPNTPSFSDMVTEFETRTGTKA